MYLTITEFDERDVETNRTSDFVDSAEARDEYAEAVSHARRYRDGVSVESQIEYVTPDKSWRRTTVSLSNRHATTIVLSN